VPPQRIFHRLKHFRSFWWMKGNRLRTIHAWMHLHVYFTSQLLPRSSYSLQDENTGCTSLTTKITRDKTLLSWWDKISPHLVELCVAWPLPPRFAGTVEKETIIPLGKICQRTSLKRGFCHRPLKKNVFAERHHKSGLTCFKTLNLLLYLILIDNN
jgi:hypothetical protein